MTAARPRSVLALVGAALALTACGSHGPSFHPAPPSPVGLATAVHLPAPVHVGLVVSSSSDPGEGVEDAQRAAGARVAQYRMDLLAPGKVVLDVVDDHGTAEGASQAVAALLQRHVAGIVCASQGPHLTAAVQAAVAARTPVVLPYAGAAGTGSWLTGPSADQALARLRAVLAGRGLTRPYVLASDAGLDVLAPAARRATLGAAGSGDAPAQTAAAVAGRGGADSVVVWGAAARTAEVVAGLQRAGAAVPVLLGPDALSPVFADRLTELGADGTATTATPYTTVGPASQAGARASAFRTAVRLAAQDPSVRAVTGEGTFGELGAAVADGPSHDAVVAIVAAAARARSAQPERVLAALAGLRLTGADGLAGPDLDLQRPDAVPAAAVVALQSTPQSTTGDDGLRAGIAQPLPALAWFAVPDGR